MRFLSILGILFYSTVIILIGVTLVATSTNILPLEHVNQAFKFMQLTPNLRIILGLSGLLLILISFSFAQLILGKYQREKTIAFNTPSGQVTVALAAVEDLIKHLGIVIPEIKELRPDVIATKKGLEVFLRVILKTEANIPDLTSRLQEITRTKIQEVLGIEEQILIKIHIAKIASLEEKDRKRKDSVIADQNFPFTNYPRA